MKILDCTLRDGGYYNNWDFSKNVVEAYLLAVAEASVNYVELGLRSFPKKGFLGAYAYTTEQHLNTLDLPVGPTYGVMVDAKTILTSELGIESAVDTLFIPACESKIGLVRIAGHFHEVEDSGQIVAKLKSLGYKVGFNLMQSGGKDSDLISEKARQAASWQGLDVFYFADSLGNMDGTEVERIINAIRKEWSGPMGIHTHDNMSKGLDNSLVANKHGVDWLDATITGMGRGAGNTQTERLLTMLSHISDKYDPKPVYDLVIRHFEPMQKQYGWGSNLLYFLGAQNDVHPTYIQNLLSNDQYGTEEIIAAIGYLSQLEGTTAYNGSILETAVNFNSSNQAVSGSNDLVDLFNGREILILTNASTTNKYKIAIETYIKKKQPIVISVNINQFINPSLIDYYIISHNVKFLTDAQKYQSLNKPIILPKHRFGEREVEVAALNALHHIDFGFNNESSDLVVNNQFVDTKYDYTSAYLLGAILVSQPQKVSLVGFDGYENSDSRQQDMLTVFSQYSSIENAPTLTALTPTTYPVAKGSIYAIY